MSMKNEVKTSVLQGCLESRKSSILFTLKTKSSIREWNYNIA